MSDSFEKYRSTLGNNVDNYDINDIQAAFLAGQEAEREDNLNIVEEQGLICGGALGEFLFEIASAIKARGKE
jgi:hypothetical protein